MHKLLKKTNTPTLVCIKISVLSLYTTTIIKNLGPSAQSAWKLEQTFNERYNKLGLDIQWFKIFYQSNNH